MGAAAFGLPTLGLADGLVSENSYPHVSSGSFLARQNRCWSRVSYQSDQGPGFLDSGSAAAVGMMAGVM